MYLILLWIEHLTWTYLPWRYNISLPLHLSVQCITAYSEDKVNQIPRVYSCCLTGTLHLLHLSLSHSLLDICGQPSSHSLISNFDDLAAPCMHNHTMLIFLWLSLCRGYSPFIHAIMHPLESCVVSHDNTDTAFYFFTLL